MRSQPTLLGRVFQLRARCSLAGMFGPSLIPRIEGDFSLRITDVIDRPDIRDEAQVMRWETKNSESTDPSLLAQPCAPSLARALWSMMGQH